MGKRPFPVSKSGSSLITLAEAPTGEIAFNIQLWRLPAPQYEYTADDARAFVSGGMPRLLFFETTPMGGPKVVSAVEVAFPWDRFRQLRQDLPAVRARMPKGAAPEAEAEVSFTDLSAASLRKFTAAVVRVAGNEHLAMLDFFGMGMYPSNQPLTTDLLESLITPQIRVYIGPSAAAALFDRMDKL